MLPKVEQGRKTKHNVPAAIQSAAAGMRFIGDTPLTHRLLKARWSVTAD
jgi:hypothetical protein